MYRMRSSGYSGSNGRKGPPAVALAQDAEEEAALVDLLQAQAEDLVVFGLLVGHSARTGLAWTAHSIHVLTLEDSLIARLTLFAKPDSPRLFEAFGLPLTLEDGTSDHAASTRHS